MAGKVPPRTAVEQHRVQQISSVVYSITQCVSSSVCYPVCITQCVLHYHIIVCRLISAANEQETQQETERHMIWPDSRDRLVIVIASSKAPAEHSLIIRGRSLCGHNKTPESKDHHAIACNVRMGSSGFFKANMFDPRVSASSYGRFTL